MVDTPEVQVSQLDVLAAAAAAPDLRVSQLDIMAVGIYPTEFVQASQLDVTAVTEAEMDLRVSQLDVYVVARGRVQDPFVRAWVFWQDSHWFYVLRLPTGKTLVYDLTTQQWLNYGSGDTETWRAFHGTNWLGSGPLMATYGSNVVVGDDGNGALYMLNPDSPTDDDAISGAEVPRVFTRMVTGQVTKRGHDYTPCYGVELGGSIGDNETDLTDVTLYTSDDSGHTFDDQGTITVTAFDYEARVDWNTGLGSFTGPGRLFRIVDDGVLQRIDWLEMADDPEAGDG